MNTSGAIVYYVSGDGNDDNDGSESSPWHTIAKVNEVVAAKAEDTKMVFCFNRGDTFRGQLSAKSNVTYTAYGTGAKPLITVSPENAAKSYRWQQVDDGIYMYGIKIMDVGSVFFNDGQSYAAKRCPDITVNGGVYSAEYGYEALEDMQFIWIPESLSAATGLTNANAENIKGYLYLRCDKGNPGEIFDNIELSLRQYVIALSSNSSNITVDNLAVKYGGAHGIGGSHQSDLLVQNCEVAYIGGGIQQYKPSEQAENIYIPVRYGNGVEVNASCDGYTVQNCWVHDVFDAGVTHQTGTNHDVQYTFKDVTYKNNLIENCTYSVEYFAYRGATTNADMLLDNILIDGNIMRNAGDGFGATRTLQPSMWNMATHIMGWYRSPNLLVEGSSFVISNNVFDRVIYSQPHINGPRINSSLILIAAEDKADLPLMKDNTYINTVGNSFAYYGENLTLMTAADFKKYTASNTAAKLLGDSDGEMYYLNK